MEEYECVEVACGCLRGRRILNKCSSGGYYYWFTGIPYAKPPLGHLRFKVSQNQDPDFDDMSSFFPCEIDDAIQYINLGYGEQAPKIVFFIVHFFVILCCF